MGRRDRSHGERGASPSPPTPLDDGSTSAGHWLAAGVRGSGVLGNLRRANVLCIRRNPARRAAVASRGGRSSVSGGRSHAAGARCGVAGVRSRVAGSRRRYRPAAALGAGVPASSVASVPDRHSQRARRHTRVMPYCEESYKHKIVVFLTDPAKLVLFCYDRASGELVWRERPPSGVEPSPVAGDGKIHVQATEGRAFVLAAGRAFRQLAVNVLYELERSCVPGHCGRRAFLSRT